ncbi:TetR/AcrR family transcriptional regulator [Kineosporia sp. NBRC 101731]|uniref:TetR/AcrR family transcriptional regulator n=1 Tax=Kineosporia sp. NBRC 101731 TaxID=3032199 RepID=UPI0024A03065|nr:TetR/AcrR family transcriptional regulator [Kineosporia sp. NBRC 101731]GLY30404.1 TetR family transcriptional regulator [Kineosporia sp. NBRC 101731]
MARTIDPARHQARRLQIIDAALTRFAHDGFDRATITAICRTAGIGSGTFFHYFPTKQAVLLAVLDLGATETSEWFDRQRDRADPLQVIVDYVAYQAAALNDPRVAGFTRAVGAVMGDEEVADALAREEAVVQRGLLPWIRATAERGEVRQDQPPERLAVWLALLLDGYVGRICASAQFDPDAEKEMLLDTVGRLLGASSP